MAARKSKRKPQICFVRKKQRTFFLLLVCITFLILCICINYSTNSSSSNSDIITTTVSSTSFNIKHTRETYHIQPMPQSKAIPYSQTQCNVINIINSRVQVCARKSQHFNLFRDHVNRESDVYRLIRRSFEKKDGKREPKAFVDIGSNHGIMSIFASKNGASTIIAVEPNHYLSRLILRSFQRNGMKSSAKLFNAACIDAIINETVRLKDHGIAEGAIGTVVRSDSAVSIKGNNGIPAVPVAAFLPINNKIKVGVLKIDVEGHELSVMESLIKSLNTNAWNIENIIVEFGPPSRWQKSSPSYTSGLAVNILNKLRRHGYEIHIMDSFAFQTFLRKSNTNIYAANPSGMQKKRYGIRVDPIGGDWVIMDSMIHCNCEAYLWLYKPLNGSAMYLKQLKESSTWFFYNSIHRNIRYVDSWLSNLGIWLYILPCCGISIVFGCIKACSDLAADDMIEYESVMRGSHSVKGGKRSQRSKRYIDQRINDFL
jgi:FkbM family methyltransferase